MICFRDKERKLKYNPQIKNNFGFLIYKIDKEQHFSLSVVYFNREQANINITIKDLFKKYFKVPMNNEQSAIIEYFKISKDGQQLSQVSNFVSKELNSLKNRSYIKPDQMKNINNSEKN